MDEPIDMELPIRRFSPVNGQRDIWKSVGFASLVLTLVSLVFTAGYNWRRIDENAAAAILEAAARENVAKDVKENYVRRDVEDQQMRNIDARLQEIRDLVQRVEAQQHGRAKE